VQHFPHWFQAATAAGTLVLEFLVVLLFFFPRNWPAGRAVRVVLFAIVTLWEIPVILTGNYAFLNYLVLCLGILLLDDRTLARWTPARYCARLGVPLPDEQERAIEQESGATRAVRALKLTIGTLLLAVIAYDTTFELLNIVTPGLPLPTAPVAVLEPFRIANQYGLFAVMTGGRYEIEFQGSNDGQNWTAYPFRYKPQALNERPRIYAPYQPRFDWNLWFASLTDWQQAEIVPLTEERLLDNDADVLTLFRGNPFAQGPPKYVRAVLWQYWFTTLAEKRATGNWWKRQLMGLYAPVVQKLPSGRYGILQMPEPLPPHS
jgi:hypothetical protein